MDEYIVKFGKPYIFEDVEYTEIDLAGLDELSTADLCRVQKQFENGGSMSVLPENNVEYCMNLAAVAVKKPIEFFMGLPAKEGAKIKRRVSKYFFVEDSKE